MIVLRGFALVLALAVATISPLCQVCGLDAEVIPGFGGGELTEFYSRCQQRFRVER